MKTTTKTKLTLLIALFALISVLTPNVKAQAATQKPEKPSGLGIYTSGLDINLNTNTLTPNKNKFHLSWNWDANLPYYNNDPYSYYYGYFGYEVNVTTLKNKKITSQDFPLTSNDLYTFNSKIVAAITNSKMTKQGFKFKVRSYVIGENNEKVYSDWSAEKLIIPRATISKVSLGKKSGNKDNVNIKFNKVSGAKSYTVYLSSNGGKSFKKVGTTTKTTYTISNKFTRGKEYYVYVAANKVKYKKKNYNSTSPIDKGASSHGFTITTKYVYK